MLTRGQYHVLAFEEPCPRTPGALRRRVTVSSFVRHLRARVRHCGVAAQVDPVDGLARAWDALEGLAVGDALGQTFFRRDWEMDAELAASTTSTDAAM